MINLEIPYSFWNDDSWDTFKVLFQSTRNNTSGKMTDISWYTKYLSDGESDVDLDELVRENERIRVRLSFLTGVKVRKIRRKKHSRNQTRESSSSSKKKREYRPLVRSIGSSKLNQYQRSPAKPIESAPQSSETFNGFEARPLGDFYSEARPPQTVKHILRPISLRHVKIDRVDSKSSATAPQSNFEEKSVPVVRYNREHSREDAHQEWHRQYSTETEEEEALKSPVVSDLVSKFESVRRTNAFSYGKTKTYDPFSTPEKKASMHTEDNQRRSIRVILHNSPPLDQMDTRVDGSSNQSHAASHEVHKTPQRTSSDATKTGGPLLRMKSEGHSRIYPAKLSGLNTTDQFSRSPSEPQPLKRGYSFDSRFRPQKPVQHHPMTLINDHLEPPAATTHNHVSVVSKLPLIPVGGANIHRTQSASKGDESYHRISSRSSFSKNPDAARQITCNIVKEEDPVPLWKSEVEMRKKTKSYVSAHKPEQPLQLGSTPEWKRLLLEKNKQKRSSTEHQHDPFNTRKPDGSINFTEPAWKQEFDKIKRQVTHQSNHQAAHVFEREVPEWVKLAEQRRKTKPISEDEDA